MEIKASCAECGMACNPGEYHPYAACLMFKACHDPEVVRENLAALSRAARGLAEGEEAFVEMEWRRKDGQVTFERFGMEGAPEWVQEADRRFRGKFVGPEPGWYCAHCQRGVDAREVTYSEQREVCGRYIASDDPPPPSAPVGVGVGDKDCLTTRARELLADEYRKRGIGTGLVNDAGTATNVAIAAIATALSQQPAAVDGADAKDAEIEALRAEVLRLRTDNSESFRDAAILANIKRDEAEARAERLAEALRASLEAVQGALQEAYNRAAPECCGRGDVHGCCGEPEPVWTPEDQAVMDNLAPIERLLNAALRDHDQEAE